MKWSKILPSADLLAQFRGVEAGLRQRRRLGSLGWLGLIVTGAIQVMAALEPWLDTLTAVGLGGRWNVIVVSGLVVAVFSLLLVSWSTFWLRESRQPFRYTCVIDSFTAVPGEGSNRPAPPIEEKMAWLAQDLKRLLNDRVQRLRFLGEGETAANAGDAKKEQAPEGLPRDSHIHVAGKYLVRQRPSERKRWEIAVMPMVRIGGSTAPEKLARSIDFEIETVNKDGGESAKKQEPASAPPLAVDEYARLVEHVYHSVASEIYRQIIQDVEAKIELLPTNYHRAVALLYEADDYARSNTFDAFQEAGRLYARAGTLLDSRLAPLPRARVLQVLRRARRRIGNLRARIRSFESRFRPRAGGIDVLCARAEMGYARMLVIRRQLAAAMGRRSNPIYEARKWALRAHARLRDLGPDTPGLSEARFDAHVVLSLASIALGDTNPARDELRMAEQLLPQRTDRDPLFLYAKSQLQTDPGTARDLLRRVAEIEPRFELARFELAGIMENLWRSHETRAPGSDAPRLECGVAETVLREYKRVSDINPANLGSWANRGYMLWLCRRSEEAEREFQRALEYKAIDPETFVSEIEYGLGRIYAEDEQFQRAYDHFDLALSALLSEGAYYAPWSYTPYFSYWFDRIGPAMLARYRDYRDATRDRVEKQLRLQEKTGKVETSPRVLRAVLGFAVYDYGEASLNFAYRFGPNLQAEEFDHAREAFEEASRLNPSFVLPYFSLNRVPNISLERKEENLKRVNELEPAWIEGVIGLALLRAQQVAQPAAEARKLEREAAEIEQEVETKQKTKADLEATRNLRRTEATANRQFAALFAGQSKDPDSRQSVFLKDIELVRKVSTGVPAEHFERQAANLEQQAEEAERAIRDIDLDIPRLQRKQSAKRKRALDLRARAENRTLSAMSSAAGLVPQRWLWAENAGGGELRWSVLDDRHLERELVWERELSEIHVRALLAWAQVYLQRVRFEHAPEKHQIDQGRKLLQHLQDHFLPSTLELLENLRDLLEEDETFAGQFRQVEERIRDVVRGWIDNDPCAWWPTTWLDRNFEYEEHASLLERVVRAAPGTSYFAEALGALHWQERAARLKAGDFEAATRLFRRSVEADPENAGYFAEQAGAWLAAAAEGKVLPALEPGARPRQLAVKKAFSLLEKAHRSDPGNEEYRRRYEEQRTAFATIERFGVEALDLGPSPERLAIVLSEDLATLLQEDLDGSEGGKGPPVKRWRNFQNLLKDAFRFEFGFQLPPVGFRTEAGSTGHYTLQIDGLATGGGELQPDRRFWPGDPEELGKAGFTAEPAIDPSTGQSGSWVPRDKWDDPTLKEPMLWQVLEFPTRHMAAVIRLHLPKFVDVDTVSTLLGDPADFARRRRRDRWALETFTLVCRYLVAEQIPLTDVETLTREFLRHFERGRTPVEIAERIRAHPRIRRLNRYLQAEYVYFRLGPRLCTALERGLRQGDRKVLALDPVDVQEMLRYFREGIQSIASKHNRFLLVAPPGLPHWVRKLVELEWPYLRTVATTELAGEQELRIRGTLDWQDPPVEWVEAP